MSLLPTPLLFRLAYQCPYRADVPRLDDDDLVDLPAPCRVDTAARLAVQPRFADVRLAWNDQGLALQVEVRGKDLASAGSAERPLGSDGLHLWIDTRDTRTIHRASRFCHQFYFLPVGGGADGADPAAGQVKIHRAQHDAPLAPPGQLLLRVRRLRGGYRLAAFIPAAALQGFDPESHPRLGFYYLVKDAELGQQSLGLGPEFPYWEDPSLWSILELVGRTPARPRRRK
ncbi:MAG TPA: hypothetical protein PKD86_04640 [Gemmatales bacterium]|nr:hypothetical protein [Gemmatales bacterium]HMP58620.1 hypothetical protein [Gemmatales bacterium]